MQHNYLIYHPGNEVIFKLIVTILNYYSYTSTSIFGIPRSGQLYPIEDT